MELQRQKSSTLICDMKVVVVVSTGPIEFSRTVGVDTMGPTEYGGDPGLIQSGPNDEHLSRLTTAERRGILVRAKSTSSEETFVDEDGATLIVRTIDAEGVDPATELTIEDNVDSEEITSDSVKPVL